MRHFGRIGRIGRIGRVGRVGRGGPVRPVRPVRLVRLAGLVALVALVALPCSAWAQRQAIPLNDHARLGQRFTVVRPFMALRVSVPSWSDNEGGLTLTLWDSPDRRKRIAERTFDDVPDNAMVDLILERRAPAGTYYWEVDRRTGRTRIGLYADPLGEDTDDCAFFDGVPQRRLSFVFVTVPTLYPTLDAAALLDRLREGTPQEKSDACRGLAVFGDARAVPDLARLLRDPDLSHMARLAIEAIPGPASDAALRAAVKEVVGPVRIGLINSLGVRRDRKAVADLIRLMNNEGDPTASAAAAALGMIGNRAAADALMKAMYAGPAQRAPGVYEGALRCADVLAADGDRERASGLYDALVAGKAPSPIRMAAARGAVAVRGADGITRLIEYLRSADDGLFRTGLWALQRLVPGKDAARSVLSTLDTFSRDRQPIIIEALGRRGDGSAVPQLIELAGADDPALRRAVIGALAVLGGQDALAALARLVAVPDADTAAAAREALSTLPREDVATAAAGLLQSSKAPERAAAVGVILRMRLAGFSDRLAQACRDADAGVRLAAIGAVGALGHAQTASVLLDTVVAPRTPAEGPASESALIALAVRLGDSARVSELAASHMTTAAPEARSRLVRILGALGAATGLGAVRGSLKDSDAGVRAEALEALCAWPTADAAPDLLKLASEAADTGDRLKCLRGFLRIAGSAEMDASKRLAMCREAAPLMHRDEERRMLLGVIGQVGLPDGLAIAEPLLDNAAVREEAAAAILAIAEKAGKPLPATVSAALEKVVRQSGNPETVKRARALLG